MQKDTQNGDGLASHLTQELGMVKALVWHDWTTGRKVPDDVPVDELLLVEIDSRGKQCSSAQFFLNGQGHKMGTVGDCFYFDRTILRWASIQHLIDA